MGFLLRAVSSRHVVAQGVSYVLTLISSRPVLGWPQTPGHRIAWASRAVLNVTRRPLRIHSV